MSESTMIVAVVQDEGDRVLLIEREDRDYHVIASTKDGVKVGDTIRYEPCGVNFGFFVKVVGT